MKKRYLILASIVMISTGAMAQKNELKAAEKALKNGNAPEAKTLLMAAEPLLATDADKAQYQFVKGNIALELANKNMEVSQNLMDAAKAYTSLQAIEKASGKAKFTEEALKSINILKGKLVNAAVELGNKDNYAEGSKLLKAVYDMDTKDMEKLYYAAGYAINGKDYNSALTYYQELKNNNYSGEGTVYYATNKESKAEEQFATKAERDLFVKGGTHEKPREEKIPSKRGEIMKNIALILVTNGKDAEAKTAIREARVANPEDSSLLLTEADLYLKLNDMDTYKKLISEALEKNPNDVDLVYNLGVISRKANQLVDAEKYFKRAIEINPTYVNAYANMAELKLSADEKIVTEMNKLGTSDKDTKRYNVLKMERTKMFTDTLPYLEKAYELNPKNEDIAKTLLSVYKTLEMSDKAKALKAKM